MLTNELVYIPMCKKEETSKQLDLANTIVNLELAVTVEFSYKCNK